MAGRNCCLATVSVSANISVHATLKSNSSCPSSTCGACPASPSVRITSVSMASTPASLPADNESSPIVHQIMAAARSQANETTTAAPPNANTGSLLSPRLETSEFNKRVKTAIASLSTLINQAKAQLAAPKTAPTELTAEEQAEAQRESAWNSSYQQKEEAIACASARNQASFHCHKLATLLHDAETGDLTVPDCSDLLSWSSNAGVTAKAECTGVSVHRLIAKFSS